MSAVEALYQQIRDALRVGDATVACALSEQARAQAPGDSRFVFMHGIALRRAGDFVNAEPLLRQVLAEDPSVEMIHHELGLALQGQGRLSEASTSFERAVALQPDLTAAWRDLYELRAAMGDDVGAGDAYRRAIGSTELDPLLKKAFDLVGAGRLGVAEGICREYLKRRPHDVDAIRLLADIGISLGLLDEAIILLERCLELAPDFHVARSNFVTALSRHQRFDLALEENAVLRQRQPGNISHRVQHAAVLSMAGRFDEAHQVFAEVLEQIPEAASVLTSYGHSLRYGGKGDQAAEAYRRAVAANPGAGEAYWSLANLKTVQFDNAQLDEMRKQYAALAKPSTDKYHLAFAIGKALEDRKEYEASFSAYAEGNDIKRQFSAYDANRTTEQVDAMIRESGSALSDGLGHPSDAPIFILGLPLAGSILLEQILASHSTVEATAELPFIGRIASELSGKRKRAEESRYPGILASLSVDERVALGQRYLDDAASYRTDKSRFVDKLPNNWIHIGLIKRILPNATIIDARRHPMAACFANFKQLFARGQEFTYSQEDIGRYYGDYLRLMNHWHEVFPGGLLTVQYESVVADLESQVRLLLEHCKLGFEQACVTYYEKDRAVRTASSEQVRQPIYRDALALWENYREFLSPLESTLAQQGVEW